LNSSLMILTEDTHGTRFFRQLIVRLKDEGFLSRDIHTESDRFGGPCNSKLMRQMKVMEGLKGYNSFIIVADADGKPLEKVSSRIRIHVPPNLVDKTEIVIFKDEIEEWICCSLGIKINSKPSTILKNKFGYEKFRLPDYVPKLDFAKLTTMKSYQAFIKKLKARTLAR